MPGNRFDREHRGCPYSNPLACPLAGTTFGSIDALRETIKSRDAELVEIKTSAAEFEFAAREEYDHLHALALAVNDKLKITIGEDQYVYVGSMNEVEDLREALSARAALTRETDHFVDANKKVPT